MISSRSTAHPGVKQDWEGKEQEMKTSELTLAE